MATIQNATLKEDNEFSFTCPILHYEAKISECFETHFHYMRGKRTERGACQALMACSKCPMIPFARNMLREKADVYYSKTPLKGELSQHLLDQIGPIMIESYYLDKYDVQGEERALILDPSQIKPRGTSHVVKSKRAAPPTRAVKAPSVEAKPEITTTSDMSAAMTGDMGAALTKALAKEKEPRPEPQGAPLTPAITPVAVRAPEKAIAPPEPAVTQTAPVVKTGLSLLEIARMKRKIA